MMKFKAKLTLTILLALGFVFFAQKSALASTLKLDPPTDSIDAGKDLSVDVILSGNSSELIDGVDAVITYDPNFLAVKEIQNGDFFGNYPIKTDDNGRIQITALAPKDGDALLGDVKVATISFEILDSGDTKIDFVFDGASTKDSNVPLHLSSKESLTAATGGEYSVTATPENLKKAESKKAKGGPSAILLFIIILILLFIAFIYWWRRRKPKEDYYTPEPFPMDRPPEMQ